MEALRGAPPPLPGTSGDGTPYGAIFRGSTPAAQVGASPSAGFSPFGFPSSHAAASGAFMVATQPASPFAAQGACVGSPVSQALPAWPFAACQGGYPAAAMTAPGVYAGAEGTVQVIAVPMAQPGYTAEHGVVASPLSSALAFGSAPAMHQFAAQPQQDMSGAAAAYFEGWGTQNQQPGSALFPQ
mmetsp:Transcript_22054/g.56255  ORF Transcript_22054/g.56255 Transcript_22054/m.56255 type:complete len:185 (+) Transcript_22054:167-721(+)